MKICPKCDQEVDRLIHDYITDDNDRLWHLRCAKAGLAHVDGPLSTSDDLPVRVDWSGV